MATVIHIRDAPAGWRTDPQYTYIGRPSYLGNPFQIGRDGSRNDVIARYRQHLIHLREEGSLLFDSYLETYIKNCILVCYCKPRACHGDVLVELIKEGA